MPFLTLHLGFKVIFEKPTFIACCEQIKEIWFRFEPFKHFSRHFVPIRFLIVIQIFWNHLCTHFSHNKILRNNLVDSTLINIMLIGYNSNFQTSILTNENPHTVVICACSHRGGASRSWFSRRFSPICEFFVPPSLVHMMQNITKRFLNLFIGIVSAILQFDTKLARDYASPFL